MSSADQTPSNGPYLRPTACPIQDVFDRALANVLSQDNPQAYTLIRVIQSTLNQYRLGNHMEVFEVLHEAYLRGKKKLQAGETIHNAQAWLKATAIHVIYERKRKQRFSAVEPHLLEAMMADNGPHLLQMQMVREDLDLLYQALDQLHQEDPYATTLLYLKTVQGWTWNEISQWLAVQGQSVPSQAALRQRASRAKRRLRDLVERLAHSAYLN
ncbi:MAG: hypothetical protein EA342_11560 [Leptolyngbya sp. LCM1.Bin17]|nr:MAG: hypothetical protein EA342_11560 [Leptolyngbya sp. LCM1.Bin17]